MFQCIPTFSNIKKATEFKMVVPVTEAMQMFKYFQHKTHSIKYYSKHIMKLKEILGKDKCNHSKVGNLDVDNG